MEKMTLHRALSELKLIDAKIEKQTADIVPVGTYQKDKLVNQVTNKGEFETAARAKYASVVDLIGRKSRIKSAIVTANASTQVVIAEKTMTIAEAINFKAIAKQSRNLINSLRNKQSKAIAEAARQNDVVNQNCQRILEVTFGKDNTKVNEKDIEAVQKPYLEANEVHLCDPLHVTEITENAESELDKFEMEVDAALSEINAVTFIEI